MNIFFRDMKIWWICPEIRGKIVKHQLIKALYVPLFLLNFPAFIVVCVSLLFELFAEWFETLGELLRCVPYDVLEMLNDSVNKVHEVLPREEINRRLNGGKQAS